MSEPILAENVFTGDVIYLPVDPGQPPDPLFVAGIDRRFELDQLLVFGYRPDAEFSEHLWSNRTAIERITDYPPPLPFQLPKRPLRLFEQFPAAWANPLTEYEQGIIAGGIRSWLPRYESMEAVPPTRMGGYLTGYTLFHVTFHTPQGHDRDVLIWGRVRVEAINVAAAVAANLRWHDVFDSKDLDSVYRGIARSVGVDPHRYGRHRLHESYPSEDAEHAHHRVLRLFEGRFYRTQGRFISRERVYTAEEQHDEIRVYAVRGIRSIDVRMTW